MENIKLKDIIEETIRREVKRAILENTDSKEVYIIKNKGFGSKMNDKLKNRSFK